MPWPDVIARLFAAPWLGHGRALECFLAIATGIYGWQLLFFRDAAFVSLATVDIASHGGGWILGLPFVAKSMLTGSGLALNIAGWRGSRPLRILGALLGTMLWSFLVVKFVLIGGTATWGFAFAVPALLFSVRIMGLAAANLPRPGAPGAV